MSDRIKRIALDFLDEGLDDWVPFAAVSSAASRVTESEPDREQLIHDLLEYLLGNGLMVAGDLGEEGHEAWTDSVEESINRILRQYKELSFVDSAYICWLANTPEGDRLARESRPF